MRAKDAATPAVSSIWHFNIKYDCKFIDLTPYLLAQDLIKERKASTRDKHSLIMAQSSEWHDRSQNQKRNEVRIRSPPSHYPAGVKDGPIAPPGQSQPRPLQPRGVRLPGRVLTAGASILGCGALVYDLSLLSGPEYAIFHGTGSKRSLEFGPPANAFPFKNSGAA